MTREQDEQFLNRAIQLAMKGRGHAEPNPMVGCVIVKNDKVIGEGYHQRYGEPHAEPNALASCTESPNGATAYVTLEPCCHLDKQTPPCVPRLIEAKIARVVVGCLDPNPRVNGRGVKLLRDAGIQVDGPLLEEQCKQLIAPFLARVSHHRAYVTMKWAETADGKVAGPGGKSMQISNKTAHRIVHELRARCDAILVGIGTVLADDPMLTSRGVPDARPCTRYVLDRKLRIPLDSRLAQTAKEVPVVLVCDPAALATPKAAKLTNLGIELLAAPSLEKVFEVIASRGATHVLIEPGPTLSRALFDANLADRLWVIRSPKRVDDDTAPPAPGIPPSFIQSGQRKPKDDVLTEYLNTKSPTFYTNSESADLVAASSA